MLRSKSKRKGAAICLTPLLGCDVEVNVHASGGHTTSGLRHCGSLGGCPVCAEVALRRRADQIDKIVRKLKDTHHIVFLTATIQHDRATPLERSLKALASGWSRAFSGRAMSKLGYVGQIRALDDTWSTTNGWHPHYHSILFFDAATTDRETVAQWCNDRFPVFRDGVRRHGLDTRRNAKNRQTGQIENVGWDVQVLDPSGSMEVLIDYVGGITKLTREFAPSWSLGREVADNTSKRRAANHWSVLRSAVTGEIHPALPGVGEAQLWALWSEWEQATKGKHVIRISKTVSAAAAVVIETEEEASHGSDETESVYSVRFTASEWMRILKLGRIADVIHDAIDTAKAAGLLGPPPPG